MRSERKESSRAFAAPTSQVRKNVPYRDHSQDFV